MQIQPVKVRPVTGQKRPRYRFFLRLTLAVLRWSFIVLGAMAVSVVTLVSIYRAGEDSYDPAMYAVGVAGLFAMLCGVMLLVLSRNSRLRVELRAAKARCEELADFTWELKEAEARAVSLLEAQGDLIVRRDGEGRITYANDAFCALAGRPRDALVNTAAALPVLEQGEVRLAADGTRMHDQKIDTAQGPRWLAWRETVVFTEKAAGAEVQSVGRDVTERTETGRVLAEARDAAEAANRAKSRFLAMASHEIRTPLNGILGMTELLIDTPLTPEQAAYVKATKTSGEALLALIEDILDFSKIEAGKLDLELRPFAPAALVEEIVELIAPRAQAKGLKIASDIDESLPREVIGDPTRLRQVLLNLAGNAVKFTASGGVGVVVEPGAGSDEIVFEVSDTGIGIPPQAQARIFLDFEQAEGGTGRKFGGTGLGLAISQRIVARMGGRIDLASAPGRGSTFRVALALPRCEDSGAPGFAAPSLDGRSVLIVAPQSIEATLLARRLTRWGAAVTMVEDRAVVAGERFDVALVDRGLDAPAGDRVARRIVLITPTERHALPGLKAAGFTGYLVKPVRAASLAARLAGEERFDEAAAEKVEPPTPAPADGRSLAVLVAEDNEINALLTRSLLERLGHRACVVASGAEALAAWRAARERGTPYDVVLMDVQMPGMDGVEAARLIRAAEAAAGDDGRTPVVALTANAFAEDRDACLAAGMDGFLAKPLSREALAATLAALPGRAGLAA